MDNYLVIQAARFGDLIQTKRLLLSLNKLGNIYLLIDKSLCGIAKIIYPYANILGVTFHNSQKVKFMEDMEVFEYLDQINFNKIFNCNYSFLTSTICRMFKKDKIVGYRPSHSPLDGILRSGWSRLAFRLASERCLSTLNLVDFWGWFTEHPVEGKQVNKAAKRGGEGLGVVISGREERRSLPADVLTQIISTIFQLSDCKTIKLFGSNKEIPKAKRIIHLLHEKYNKNIKNFVGKTSLISLEEEISDLDLLLTPDTGIMHLAAHKGIPVMAFFLSSAYCHETGPYGEGHIIFQANISCSPCLESATCNNKLECLSPFKNKMFAKELADIYQGKFSTNVNIEGLQCWMPEFDSLGQNLKLIKGHDKNHNYSDNLRNLIKNYLGLYVENFMKINLSYDEQAKLIEKFFPQSEWMLPSKRYS